MSDVAASSSSSSSTTSLELASIRSTFGASVRSVGTAVTLAAVGFYLHRQGSVGGDGKRTLALISQQVTVPLFLFTRILYCNQDWSEAPCPDVTRSLGDVWMLLFWPAVVVTLGWMVGVVVARVCHVPIENRRLVWASCAFGNSTGLPITLLTVVHANFPTTSDLGHIDPTLFLSVYLLLYPVLQWGLGGYLLAPPDEEQPEEEELEKVAADEDPAPTPPSPPPVSLSAASSSLSQMPWPVGPTMPPPPPLPPPPGMPRRAVSAPPSHSQVHASSSSSSNASKWWGGRTTLLLRHNVLNNVALDAQYRSYRHGLVSSDESMYLSEVDLVGMVPPSSTSSDDDDGNEDDRYGNEPGAQNTNGDYFDRNSETDALLMAPSSAVSMSSLRYQSTSSYTAPTANATPKEEYLIPLQGLEKSVPPPPVPPSHTPPAPDDAPPPPHLVFDADTLGQVVRTIMSRCLQPPVVGGLLGLAVASWPSARGILVDLEHRRSRAPLQWCFDALYSVGQAAVPLNMMILGANLSSAAASVSLPWIKRSNRRSRRPSSGGGTVQPKPLFDGKTLLGIVVGKMVVLPLLGIGLGWILKTYVWNIPDEIDGAFYLVLMIVFLCPTANNVMVMVELSGSVAKEGLAQVIALQYLVAPLILSITMTIAVGVASGWS